MELTPNGIKLANGESISFVNQPLSVANRPLSEANQPLSATNRPQSDIKLEHFAHLAELEIVNRISLSDVNRLPIGGQSVAATDRKKAIKNFIQEHGDVKTADLVKVFGLSDGYVRALLRMMVEDGTIEKVGSNRYACYRLKKEK